MLVPVLFPTLQLPPTNLLSSSHLAFTAERPPDMLSLNLSLSHSLSLSPSLSLSIYFPPPLSLSVSLSVFQYLYRSPLPTPQLSFPPSTRVTEVDELLNLMAESADAGYSEGAQQLPMLYAISPLLDAIPDVPILVARRKVRTSEEQLLLTLVHHPLLSKRS